MTASAPAPEILFSVRGPLGLVTLNRPQALNALTLGMYLAFDRQLAAWQRDDAIRAVVVRGAGRAFCAGGDVVHVAESGLAARIGGGDGGALARDAFFVEYRLDRRIATLGKPYLPLLDGFTLGGGAGISLHGSHPIATEHTRFAMPECVIGLFPDIGASHFLARCPGRIGDWLGLTGARLAAADLVYAGLVRHYVPQARLEALVAALAAADWSAPGDRVADEVIAGHASAPGEPPLAAHRALIDRCFGHDTVEEMVAALEAEPGEFAHAQLEALRRGSPTSLKVTLRQLRQGACLSLEDCLRLDYRLSQAFMAEHDFYEGIRAALVDKDKHPRWQPPTLAGVSDELVDRHFRFRPPREQSFTEEWPL
ncbi:MAG: enoyl-CoA hydratase/isomerase family protein [Rhodospirillaceae bacterium]